MELKRDPLKTSDSKSKTIEQPVESLSLVLMVNLCMLWCIYNSVLQLSNNLIGISKSGSVINGEDTSTMYNTHQKFSTHVEESVNFVRCHCGL